MLLNQYKIASQIIVHSFFSSTSDKKKNQHAILAFVTMVAFSISSKQSTDAALHPSLLIIPDQVTLT